MPDNQNPAFDIEGSLISPNIGNYYIGKGEVFIRLLGESQYTPCGNCPTFEFTAKVTQLDHYSSMTGVKVKDFTAVTEINGSLTIVLEEFTARNMGFALLGLPTGGPSPTSTQSKSSPTRLFTERCSSLVPMTLGRSGQPRSLSSR